MRARTKNQMRLRTIGSVQVKCVRRVDLGFIAHRGQGRQTDQLARWDMRRPLPSLNALRACEAAGRLGSFTKAAEELNVSHSAISRHVRGLEKRLNVHLFRTRKTGVALTEQGPAYLSEITPAFDRIADATEALTVSPKGTVTLTT
jgi:hypothetical protein